MYYKFKDLTNNFGPSYIERFAEKLAYCVGNNLNKEVSALNTIKLLAEEMVYSDDGYLWCMVKVEYPIDPTDDIYFKLHDVNSEGFYSLHVNGEEIGQCDSLSSSIRDCIENFFL